MKKQLALMLCALTLISASLSSCTNEEDSDKAPELTDPADHSSEPELTGDTSAETTASITETLPKTETESIADTEPESIAETEPDTQIILPITWKNPLDETAPLGMEAWDTVMSALDIIMRYDGIGSAEDFIAAYPSAYKQITDLGEDALPALQSILDESDDNDRKSIARYAMNEINPSLYEYTFTSPDGRYKLSLCDVDSPNAAMQWYYGYHLNDAKTGEELLKGDIETSILAIQWSDDGRYAVITAGHARYFSEPIIINLENLSEIRINTNDVVKAIDAALPDKGYTDFTLNGFAYSYHYKITEWFGDDNVKIQLYSALGAGGNEGLLSATFTFDLIDGSFSELEFEVQLEAKNESPSPMNPSHETAPEGLTMEETIRADLAILARVGWGGCFADDCIDTYPDAYAQIIAFGDDALDVLNDISAKNAADFADEAKDFRQFQYMARAIRYKLHPEVYDRFYDSPDGSYRVQLTDADTFDDTSATCFNRIDVLDPDNNPLVLIKSYDIKDESVVFCGEKFAVIYNSSIGLCDISVYGTDSSNAYLPRPYEIIEAAEERLAENGITGFTLSNKQCNTKVSFSGFEDEDHVRVDFTIYINPKKTYSEFVGSYVYSLKDKDFTEFSFTAVSASADETDNISGNS